MGLVFDPTNKGHSEFKPVLVWLLKGKGKFIYGGKTYKDELRKLCSEKYYNVLTELSRSSKVIVLPDEKIDKKEQLIKNDLKTRRIKMNDKRYNDAHIVAIISVSKVRLVSSGDKKSYRFLREDRHYDSPKDIPAIYSQAGNKNLLNDSRYYGKCCR
jgi:hypothetical protein